MIFIFTAEYYLMSTKSSIKTFEETTFKQEMFHSQGEIVPRIERFTLGKAFVANDIICYGDKHLMFSSICVKQGNSLFRRSL